MWDLYKCVEEVLTNSGTDTKLADRTAAAGAKTRPQNTFPSGIDLEAVKALEGADRNASLQRVADTQALAETRRDLSEAQRSRGILQARIDDASTGLQKYKLQLATNKKRLDELTQEKLTLTQRVKDRDEELKGKAKLLEDIHDETVSLTLQLNMAEDQAQKLRNENENLIKRWMERMGKEADAMNEASRFT
ncbi:MAG: hypothetical protein Q9218_001990 [Villophora microphyllina]